MSDACATSALQSGVCHEKRLWSGAVCKSRKVWGFLVTRRESRKREAHHTGTDASPFPDGTKGIVAREMHGIPFSLVPNLEMTTCSTLRGENVSTGKKRQAKLVFT